MTGFKLRDYQEAAARKVLGAFGEHVNGRPKRPVVVLPTGGGKTVTFTVVADRYVDRLEAASARARRVLVLAHREELITQAARTMRKVFGVNGVGIVMAEQNQPDRPVVCATIQTLGSERRLRSIKDIGLVIVDECHHAVSASWTKVIEHYAARGARVLGVTATPNRADRRGLIDVFDEIVHEVEMVQLMREGHLIPPRGVRLEIDGLNLDAVKKSKGDYQDGALADALSGALAHEVVAKAVVEHRPAGTAVILFAPTVACAHDFSEALNDVGLRSAVVSGTTHKTERRASIAALGSGGLDVLCNVGVLTEGTDIPAVGMIVMARPTQSEALYRQMVGRGLRPHPGQDECVVLDVAGSTRNNRLQGVSSLLGAEHAKREPKDGQNLLDLFDELEVEADAEADRLAAEAERAAEEARRWRGPVRAEDVPLLAASPWKWQATNGGAYFIGTKSTYAFTMERPGGGWCALVVPREHRTGRPAWSWLAQSEPTRADAMAAVERQLEAERPPMPLEARRARAELATDKQISNAAGYGADVELGMTVGQVQDATERARASWRIDSMIDQWSQAMEGGAV